ncbi:MAG: hypothetical protein FWG89_02940 [Treponema sp.]|nr:hypothetical protein [Treponema sp.]
MKNTFKASFLIIALAVIFVFAACDDIVNNGHDPDPDPDPPPSGNVIFDISIFITVPVVGEAPVAAASTVSNQYTSGNITWQPEVTGGLFAAETAYRATVTLTAEEDYTFLGTATPLINNDPAGTEINMGNYIILWYHFERTDAEPEPVTAVTLQITAPVTERMPSTNATFTSNQYTASAITWSPAIADAFLPQMEYTASVTITAASGFNFIGMPDSVITINGTNTGVTVTRNSSVIITLSYTFPETDPGYVEIAGVSVTWPITGAVPDTTVTSPGFDGYNYTAAVTWSPAHATFEPSTAYTATVVVTAMPGNIITGGFTGTVNGEAPGTTTTTQTTATLIREFPATTPTPYIITASGGGFNVRKDGTTIGTDGAAIQAQIDAIRAHSTGAVGIQLGDGGTTLNVGTFSGGGNSAIEFANGSGANTWGGQVTISGRVSGQTNANNAGIITGRNGVNLLIVADITNTGSGEASTVMLRGNPTIHIAGGSHLSNVGGEAMMRIVDGAGNLTISGGNLRAPSGRVMKIESGSATVRIIGGTITSGHDNDGEGLLFFQNSGTTFTLTGGRIEGTVRCNVIRYESNIHTFNLGGTAHVIGRHNGNERGVIRIQRGVTMTMNGGRIENLDTGGGNTIYAGAGGGQNEGVTVTINSGTVFKAGSGFAVRQNNNANVTIGPNANIIGSITGNITDNRP